MRWVVKYLRRSEAKRISSKNKQFRMKKRCFESVVSNLKEKMEETHMQLAILANQKVTNNIYTGTFLIPK